jgi:hypothetical protein
MHTPDLPKSEQDLIATLSKESLWRRVQDLSEVDPPRRRSTVRSWVVKKLPETITSLGNVPVPPVKKPRSVRQRPKSPGIPHDEQLVIARLSPLARRYRSRTSPKSTSFTANTELTNIAGQLYLKGVTVSELARASGVTYRAMKRRVDRALIS